MSHPARQPLSLPVAAPHLEEAASAVPADVATALAFALWRTGGSADPRPVVLVASRTWLNERGRLFGQGAAWLGIDPARLMLVAVDREIQSLWAMEEALKSGAAAGVLGVAEAPPFVATRRLDFAAAEGRSAAMLLRDRPAGDLSAARLRWRVAAAPSAPNPFDIRAPGAARMQAELVRRRSGPLGTWMLEQDDEAGGFRLAAGLAGHGLDPRRSAAA